MRTSSASSLWRLRNFASSSKLFINQRTLATSSYNSRYKTKPSRIKLITTKYDASCLTNTSTFRTARTFSIKTRANEEKWNNSLPTITDAREKVLHSQNTKDSKEAQSTVGGEVKSKRRRISKVPISEVLKAKHTLRWVAPVISMCAPVREAILVCIEGGLSGMMVVDREEHTSSTSHERGKVVGMTTSRDLLRVIASGLKDSTLTDEILNKRVDGFMTPISQVIYARPEETIGMCRTIMAKLGVKCLPILSEGRVEGLVTSKDLQEFGLKATDRGGKKSYLRDVTERKGLSSETSMAEPPIYLKSHLAQKEHPLYVNVGVMELPHPFKTENGCMMNQREFGKFGKQDYPTDPGLSEDAHFVAQINIPDEQHSGELKEVVYMGVADGVGSWRQHNVDPRLFSGKLMLECKNILLERSYQSIQDKSTRSANSNYFSPSDIMAHAYERVKADNIVGSSTACVAVLDGVSHQLLFSNLGDSGIIVLRHIDSDIAGTLKRDRRTKKEDRKSDLRPAFVSQQQLRSFNFPYQLGWTGENSEYGDGSFETATDCCTSSVHVRRGDIILMATDGLFDNVDIDDIANIALEWEMKNGFLTSGGMEAREKRWAKGHSYAKLSTETLPDLAKALCERARENSLDASTDSPFAILAKENDIMWGGGMPDDCMVIAMHVVGKMADGLEE